MVDQDVHRAIDALVRPTETFTRDDVLSRPCPVPAVPGVYAWYFDSAPPGVTTDDCVRGDAGHLLYVGISPKAPSRDGLKQSRQTLRTRVRYHYRGNAAGSTLRLTLGSLLADEIGIGLRRVGSGSRLTFSDGEAVLSQWMSDHARVCWVETPAPWLVESMLIRSVRLPLNLDQNKHSGFHEQLRLARARQRELARGQEVVAR